MKPSAEGSSTQPLPPDKPPWVVEKAVDYNQNLLDKPIGTIEANQEVLWAPVQCPIVELGGSIEGCQQESKPKEVSETHPSPREQRYAKYSARRGGVRLPVVGGAHRDKKKVRFSPLLLDLRVKEFVHATTIMLKDKPLALQEHRFQTHEGSPVVATSSAGDMEVENNALNDNQVTVSFADVIRKDSDLHDACLEFYPPLGRLKETQSSEIYGLNNSEIHPKSGPQANKDKSSTDGSGGVPINPTDFIPVSHGKTAKGRAKQVETPASTSKEGDKGKDKAKTDGGIPNSNNKKGGFDFSRAVNGDKGKVKQNQASVLKSKEGKGVSLGNWFTVLEEANIQPDGSQGAVGKEVVDLDVVGQGEPSSSVPTCTMSKEVDMDIGLSLPDSVMETATGNNQEIGSLSEYKKSVIMGYINGTAAVPNLVANAWSTAEWIYFQNQCTWMGYEPEHLIVDDEAFMEDNLLDVKSIQPLPENKKQAILKALNSSVKAVMAKHMMSWTVAERVFFREQVTALGLDMTYAIEDVEEEANGMAAMMAGQFLASMSSWLLFFCVFLGFCDVSGSWVCSVHPKTHRHHGRYSSRVLCIVGFVVVLSSVSRLFRGWVHLAWKGWDFSCVKVVSSYWLQPYYKTELGDMGLILLLQLTCSLGFGWLNFGRGIGYGDLVGGSSKAGHHRTWFPLEWVMSSSFAGWNKVTGMGSVSVWSNWKNWECSYGGRSQGWGLQQVLDVVMGPIGLGLWSMWEVWLFIRLYRGWNYLSSLGDMFGPPRFDPYFTVLVVWGWSDAAGLDLHTAIGVFCCMAGGIVGWKYEMSCLWVNFGLHRYDDDSACGLWAYDVAVQLASLVLQSVVRPGWSTDMSLWPAAIAQWPAQGLWWSDVDGDVPMSKWLMLVPVLPRLTGSACAQVFGYWASLWASYASQCRWSWVV
ncbi:hypothetical protein E3N88_38315 [Mikania micrantha]|uniref:Uncharacterized protein n=1 Tax=Mikania micrantha TaxID=192012 RepID=A0A5N6LTM7_9ASTR|nr:hypothetical protein E3N88_38315 [Mikania micrantha]